MFIAYVLPFHLTFIAYANVFTYCGAFLLYGVIVVPFILLEFRLGRKRRYFAVNSLRRPPCIWVGWRTVQLLQNQINTLLGVYIAPTQAIFGQMVVTCVFMLFHYNNELSVANKIGLCVWIVLVTIFWSLVLLMGGLVHFYGLKVIDSWKYHDWKEISMRDKKAMKKFRKSCRPLAIGYGNTYVIKRLTVLKFIRSLIRGIFRALMTLGAAK